MKNIEQKALALVNERRDVFKALCRAIEQYEAFKQEVSDKVDAYVHASGKEGVDEWENLKSLIIPDPIAEAWIEATGNTVGMGPLNEALEARGLEIREKGL